MKAKIATVGAIIVFCVFIAWIFLYNLKNNDKFFEASIVNIATIVVAVVVSFFLAQRKTDKRRKNEKIDNLVSKIQDYVNDDDFVKGGESTGRKNLLLHRSVSNKLKYLKREKIDTAVKKEIEIIEKNFKEYRHVYGDYYLVENKLQDHYNELKNYLLLIDDACDKIHMLLM